jgi:hypothetical protein
MQLGDIAIQRACKRHQCHYCGEVIEIGTVYTRWAWKDDGDLLTVKCHPECHEAWGELGDEELGFGEMCRGCTCERGFCECGKESK